MGKGRDHFIRFTYEDIRWQDFSLVRLFPSVMKIDVLFINWKRNEYIYYCELRYSKLSFAKALDNKTELMRESAKRITNTFENKLKSVSNLRILVRVFTNIQFSDS